MTVARIKTSTGWLDLTRVGPTGPPGGSAISAQIGNGSAQSFVVTHGMGTRNVQVDVYRTAAPYDRVIAEIERTDLNTVTVRTTTVPAADELTVVVSAPGSLGGGSDVAYVHTQSSPAATWTITHNLGKYPSVSVVDSGGTVIDTDVHYTSVNQLEVIFASATSGKAYLN